jgi:hypothetical protein
MNNNKTTLLDKVDDGFNYFNGFRLEEVKEYDKYYIESFMSYIEVLECKVDRLTKELRK